MTAKLSKRFYDVLGEDVAQELVRWMFAFWVTNFIGIAGLVIALRSH